MYGFSPSIKLQTVYPNWADKRKGKIGVSLWNPNDKFHECFIYFLF